MKIHMLKTENHAGLGRLSKGREYDVPEPWASRWCQNGSAERYETKVIREVPLPVAGQEQPLSASPVAQVLTKTTPKKLKRGVKKKKGAES